MFRARAVRMQRGDELTIPKSQSLKTIGPTLEQPEKL
jgi:hypothetical protein